MIKHNYAFIDLCLKPFLHVRIVLKPVFIYCQLPLCYVYVTLFRLNFLAGEADVLYQLSFLDFSLNLVFRNVTVRNYLAVITLHYVETCNQTLAVCLLLGESSPQTVHLRSGAVQTRYH